MKKVAKILEIVFHILGFPLLLVLIAVASIATIKGGIGYGLPVFIGLILTAVLCIAYYVAYFIMTKGEKKRREKNKARVEAAVRTGSYRPSTQDPGIRTGVILAIIAVCCLSGLWAAVDTLLPDMIADATSSTVYWEDLTDNWQARGEVHEDLLDTFIRRAFYAGSLKNKTLKEYLNEGIRNKEVKELIDAEYESIDKNGYGTYIGPSIGFAQDERMTIPALVHLLLDKRSPITDENGKRLDKQIPLSTFEIVLSEETDEELTSHYQYLRHNQQYYYYDENFDEVLSPTDGLIVVAENKGYRKIEFLSANKKVNSYVYIIDTVDGLRIDCKVYSYDHVVETSVIEQVKNGYKVTKSDETENVFGSLDDLFENEADEVLDHYGFFLGVNPAGVTAEDLLSGSLIPDGWYINKYNVLRKSIYYAYADWNVLDMLGEPMGFELPLSSISEIEFELGPVKISGSLLFTDYAPTLDDVLATASFLTEQQELLGSKLTLALDFETGELSLVPINVERGTLDYMKMAWLYNNGLLYVLVSLFSTRKLYLIFAAVIALTSFLIGYMHELAAKDESTPKERKRKFKKGNDEIDSTVEYIDDID